EIIKHLPVFSFKSFRLLWREEKTSEEYSSNLEILYNIYIKKLEENEQEGTAENYKDSLRSLLKFQSNLQPTDITVEFLNKYEKWILSRGLSPSTVGIYLRPLR